MLPGVALCVMVQSSRTMNQQQFDQFRGFVDTANWIIGFSQVQRMLKFECAVRPPVAGIPDEATKKTMSMCCQTLTMTSLVTNVSPVPERASNMDIPPLDNKTVKKFHKHSFGQEIILEANLLR